MDVNESPLGRGSAWLLIGLALLVGAAGGYLIGATRVDDDSATIASAGVADFDSPEGRRRAAPKRAAGSDPANGGASDSRPSDEASEDRAWMIEALRKEKIRRDKATYRDDDDGRMTLSRILDYGADTDELFESFERFSKPLRVRKDPEKVVRLTPETAEQILQDLRRGKIEATTFLLSEGEFVLDLGFVFRDGDHYVIRGEGMDRTHVKTQWSFAGLSDVQQLTIADLSFDRSVNHQPLIHSNGPAAVLLERVRAKGFDSSGIGAAVYFDQPMYIACDGCEFIGGYGSGPLHGQAAMVRGRGFLYFRNCLMRELESVVYHREETARGARALLDGCRVRHLRSFGEQGAFGELRYRNCTIEAFGVRPEVLPAVVDLGGNVVSFLPFGTARTMIENIAALERSGEVFSGLWVTNTVYGDLVPVPPAKTAVRNFFPGSGPPEPRLGAPASYAVSAESPPSISLAAALTAAVDVLESGGAGVTLESARVRRAADGSMNWQVRTTYGTMLTVDGRDGRVLQQ